MALPPQPNKEELFTWLLFSNFFENLVKLFLGEVFAFLDQTSGDEIPQKIGREGDGQRLPQDVESSDGGVVDDDVTEDGVADGVAQVVHVLGRQFESW